MANKNLAGYALRLFIMGSSCSGYQYGLGLDNNIEADDSVYETGGIKLVVANDMLDYLQGTTVDYIENEDASGFRISNPHPLASCGCGQSSASTSEQESCGCSGCG
jgi:iron-sulfur cluster assembly accessory protein